MVTPILQNETETLQFQKIAFAKYLKVVPV